MNTGVWGTFHVLRDICTNAVGRMVTLFFENRDQQKAAMKEWVDYQNMTGPFSDCVMTAHDWNPLYFWNVSGTS
jgi:hypothetical protein